MIARRRVGAVVATTLVAIAMSACGSTSHGASAKSTTTAATTRTPARSRTTATVHGKRYCEVLLLTKLAPPVADVYNSFPMNDCPADRWAALDAKTIASENHVPLAVLNGPRYWLMDGIQQVGAAAVAQIHKDFGGIAMIRRATVQVGSIATASKPYALHAVDRATIFTFDAGRTVYELTAADGSVYVMQTYSQQKDPVLAESALAGLASRLTLPSGWSFHSRTLATPLVVDTTKVAAQVLQDDLGNSYSLEAS